jgi:hypothetical protein
VSRASLHKEAPDVWSSSGAQWHADDEGRGRTLAEAAKGAACTGIEVSYITGVERIAAIAQLDFERAGDEVNHLVPLVDVRAERFLVVIWKELRDTRSQTAIRYEDAKALSEMRGI